MSYLCGTLLSKEFFNIFLPEVQPEHDLDGDTGTWVDLTYIAGWSRGQARVAHNHKPVMARQVRILHPQQKKSFIKI